MALSIPCQQTDEVADVAHSLGVLYNHGFLPSPDYDDEAFGDYRRSVKACFEVPWTSITSPMERLLFAIGAALAPRTTVAIGTFCGNTLAWVAGPSLKPWTRHEAERIVGVEIDLAPCQLSRGNFQRLGCLNQLEILCADGHEVLQAFEGHIDLLYLDANGPLPGTTEPSTKLIYLSLLQHAEPHLHEGSLVLAHDTLPAWFPQQAGAYLEYVRDPSRFRDSASIHIDSEGLEVTLV